MARRNIKDKKERDEKKERDSSENKIIDTIFSISTWGIPSILLVTIISIFLKLNYSSHYKPTPTFILKLFQRKAQPFNRKTDDERIANFLAWVVANGGSISPSVTIESYEKYGGFGLKVVPSSTPIKKMDKLFTIPASIIISAQSVVEQYNYRIPQFQSRLYNAMNKFYHPPMVQQDIIIALYLMIECNLGSRFRQYCEILPTEIIPRLDTFDDDELSMLQDEQLRNQATYSFNQLYLNWDDTLKELSHVMVRSNPQKPIITLETHFLSFKTFHKYVALVSSRTMILQGTKWLTPLADIINYAPRNDNRISSMSESFMVYHHHDASTGSITVRSDRNVLGGEQIYEDYGDTDNSLFLEAHGFVPDHNPFHCAMLAPEFFPSPQDLASNLWNALVELKSVISPVQNFNSLPALCVSASGTTINSRDLNYLKLFSLFQNPKQEQQQQLCIVASNSLIVDEILLQCIHYAGHTTAYKHILVKSAQKALSNASSSIEEDIATLAMIGKNGHVEIEKSKRVILALKFRIADKRILYHLGKLDSQR